MKSKWKVDNYIIKYLSNRQEFKLINIASIILSIYGGLVLGIDSLDLFNSTITTFMFPAFNLLLFLILFFNTLSICRIFDKEFHNYIIRLENKKRYIIKLLYFSMIMNFIVIANIFIIFFGIMIFFKSNNITISKYYNYNVNNLIYMIFYLIRYILITINILILNTLLYSKIKNKIIIIDSVFVIGLYLPNICNFLYRNFNYTYYSSFLNEVLQSLLLIAIMVLINFLIYIFINKKKIKIGLIKYLLLNDVNYLIKNRRYIILIIVFAPLFLSFLYINDPLDSLLNTITGVNLNKESLIIEIILYILNIVISIFIIYDLFIKDLRYQLDNIFLRVKTKEWYYKKLLLSILISFILKLVKYILLYIIIYINYDGIEYSSFLNIFITDFIYTGIIQLIALFIYTLSLCYKKYNILFFSLLFIFFVVIPKNIIKMSKYNILMIVASFIIILLIGHIINKKGKKIIEGSRG